MRRGYFIVATVLRAPYCAPFPFAPARHYYQSGGVIRQRETAATSSCDCRLLSNSSIRKRACYAATKAAGYRDGTFNHRRRQRKRCGSRHLYRYAERMPFRRSISPADYIAWDTFTARNVSAARAYIRYCGSPATPSAFDEGAAVNACIW